MNIEKRNIPASAGTKGIKKKKRKRSKVRVLKVL